MKMHQELEDLLRYEKEHGPLPAGPVYLAISGALFASLAFLAMRLVFRSVLPLLADLLRAVPETLAAGMVGGVVLAAGAAFYQVRTRTPFAYACLELGSAVGIAVEAYLRLKPDGSRATLAFALLASVYVAVRGFDNVARAKSLRQAKRVPVVTVDKS